MPQKKFWGIFYNLILKNCFELALKIRIFKYETRS